jgi:hypothetical protein
MAKRPQKPPIIPVKINQIHGPSIPMSQEKWIGRIVVEWSKLEGALEDMIWLFLDLPMEFGRAVTATMDVSFKLKILRQLNELCCDPLLRSYLSELFQRIDFVREDRNFIIHGSWGRVMPDNIPIALSLRPKDTPSTVVSETFPPERMRQIHETIIDLNWRLMWTFESAAASRQRARRQFPGWVPMPLPSRWRQD